MHSALPYRSQVQVEDVASGLTQVIALPAPLRGELTRFTIKQMTGSLQGYTFTLLDRPPIDEGLSPVDPDVWSEESTRLLGPTSVANAQATYAQELNPRVAFNAWQLSSAVSGGSRDSYLYLKLTPAGTGNKTFEVAYQTMIPS